MNCAKAQSLMLDQLYGDLKPARERALLRHLQECSNCSAEFEKHKATASAFAKLDMEEPPPGLSAQLVAMATDEMEKQKSVRTLFSRWNWKPMFASVAMAALAIFIVIKYVPTISESEKPMAFKTSPKYEKTAAASMPAPPTEEPGVVSRSEISPSVESEASNEAFHAAEYAGRKGDYGLDKDTFGDDNAANKITSDESNSTALGLAGGKAQANEPRASSTLARAQVPPQEKKELHALGYSGSSSTPDFRADRKGYHAGEEGARAPADALEMRPHASGAEYAEIDAAPSAGAAEEPAIIAAKPKQQPQATTMPAPAKEESTVGGASLAMEKTPRREIGQEEHAPDEALFDSGELNKAIMDSEKKADGKIDKKLTADYAYKLAKTYQEQHECDKALAVLGTIPKEHPDFDKLDDVYLSMGECYYELAMVGNGINTTNLENAQRSLDFIRNKFPESSSDARLEGLQNNISLQEETLFEYAYSNAETKLDSMQCDVANELFKKMPDTRYPVPEAQLKKRSALADVYFAITKCYTETGEYKAAIGELKFMYLIFPEKRDIVLQKINETTAMQEAAEKAKEQSPTAGKETSPEKPK